MDTIVLSWSFYKDQTIAPILALLASSTAPTGLKAWIYHSKPPRYNTCWIKINCHNILNFMTAMEDTTKELRQYTDNWLSNFGLCVDDFLIHRIDYDYNFRLSSQEEIDVLLDTMQNLPSKTLRQTKGDWKSSVYYQNKSKHSQLYDKCEEQRKKKIVNPWFEGAMRQEIQCHARHIKYRLKSQGLARCWDNWVDVREEEHYLTNARAIFPVGDFYHLSTACDMVMNANTLTPHYQRRLCEMLTIVQSQSMAALRDNYSTNTIKVYLKKLELLNINPLTIKANPYGIDFIANPFRKALSKGGAV